MNDEDLNKLREIIKEAIRPVKNLVEMTKKKVDGQEIFIHSTTENVRTIKEQQSVINEKMDGHTEILQKHGGMLEKQGEILEKQGEILEKHGVILEKQSVILEKHGERLDALWEQTVKLSKNMEEVKEAIRSNTKFVKGIVAIADQNNENAKKLDKRVRVLENRSGIVPPIELNVVG